MIHHDATDTKSRIHGAFAALASAPADQMPDGLAELFAPDAAYHGQHPVNDLTGPAAIAAEVWQPLARSFRYLRRADDFFTGGSFQGSDWISAMGYLHGVFADDYLGIPATQNWAYLRYGEFHRIEGGRITQSHVIFDLPELMRQAGVPPWPVGLGVHGLMPGPASRDGVVLGRSEPAESRASLDLVERMIFEGFVAADMHTDPSWMQAYWTEDMFWYGPCLIGAAKGLPGFYRFDETPWEEAFTTRGPRPTRENKHVTRFGDGAYCSFTGWPSIYATHTGPFLGLPATGRDVDIRVMDFYHRRGDRLDENWVFIDMPHLFLQLGIDLFARMADLRGAR
jgi:hypothetical protein